MPAYILPQVQVFQEFRQVPTATTLKNSFILGPHYQVVRGQSIGDYNKDADVDYAYPSQAAGSVVDVSFFELYMSNLWAQYAHIPESVTNPLVAVSPVTRNKLRAAPRIEEAAVCALATGVGMQSAGYFTGGQTLPESFYMFPYGGWNGTAWAATSFVSAINDAYAEDAKLKYVTTEGYNGIVDLPAVDHPLTAGVHMQGPEGIVLDLDAGTRKSGTVTYLNQPVADDEVAITVGALVQQKFIFDPSAPVGANEYEVVIGADAAETFNNLKIAINEQIQAGNVNLAGLLEAVHTAGTTDLVRIVSTAAFTMTRVGTTFDVTASSTAYNSLRAPVTIRVVGNGDSYFTIAPAAANMANLIDAMLATSPKTMKFRPTVGAGAESVAFSTSTLLLTLTAQSGTSTLKTIRDALVAISDAATWLDIGEVVGDETEDVVAIIDETGFATANGYDIVALRDAYRVTVQPNEYLFAAGNGYTPSSHFKTRGVKVGDRIRWEYVDTGLNVHSGFSKITGLEADYTAALTMPPTFSANNKATQAGTALGFKTGAAIVTFGTDNQRKFNGVNTKLFALDPVASQYPGEYNMGVIDENITVTITTGGAANTARASVVSTLGTYNRTNVQIISRTDATEAAIYIGRNLWVVFDQGATDADAIFQVGDTYMFSADVEAPYTAIASANVASSGRYRGTKNTTYVIEVVRGGVFNRTAAASDGLLNPSVVTITFSGLPSAGDTITIGGTVFEFDGATPGYVPVVIAGTLAATLTNLAAAVNADVAPVTCTVSTTVATFKGAASVLATAAKSGTNIGAPVIATAALTPVVTWEDWTGGDVNDEYILRCSKAGTLTTAEFSLESQRGDDALGIKFTGSGSGFTVALGAQGLQGYFTVAGSPSFSIGDYWVIHLFGSRPQVKITDTVGSDQSSLAVVDNDVAIPLGLNGSEITFAANSNDESGFVTGGGLSKDEVFYVEAVASVAGPVKVLVLADDLPASVVPGLAVNDMGDLDPTNDYISNADPTRFSATLYLVQATNTISKKRVQSPPDYNWLAVTDKFTVYSGIEVQDASWVNLDGSMPYIPVYRAALSIRYRALLSDYADTIYSIGDIGDVATQLGEISVDNPLAMGVYEALLNSGDRSVYFMGTPTNDLAGYTQILDRAALNDIVYAFAPMTRDLTILQAIEAHINTMSTETEKKWRIGFFGTQLPTTRAVYTKATNPTSVEWEATVTTDPGRPGAGNVLMTITNGEPEATEQVKAGDRILLNFSTDAWGDATYETYEVLETPVANSTIKLVSGPALPINVAQKFECWHDNSVAEIATAVAAITTGFGNRRIMHVFPTEGYNGTTLLTSEFAAAQVAGLCCSVAPQQGLTNVEVNGFTDLPMIYRTFTKDQLNEMAAAGTLILMQAMPGSRIYIRHQLTTAAAQGNLNTSELSMTKNLDSISYYFADLLAPYIGIYNVTPELVDVLETEIGKGISYLSSLTGVGLLGPQLLAESTEIVSIQQHPTLKDHIICIMNVGLPPPFNVIELHLVV